MGKQYGDDRDRGIKGNGGNRMIDEECRGWSSRLGTWAVKWGLMMEQVQMRNWFEDLGGSWCDRQSW